MTPDYPAAGRSHVEAEWGATVQFDMHIEGRRGAVVEWADVDHLMDLLELLPWEPGEHGNYHIPGGDLWNVLDQTRWSLLANAQIDYNGLRKDHRDEDAAYRLCVYMADVFDSPPDEVMAAVGALIVQPIGLDSATGEATGRRWCEDVASTAWRLLVSHIAASQREARNAGG